MSGARPEHYRPDIDGIRGIAVLSVLLYHGFPSFLPGGFVGVDVFFVISGYLISSIIFRDLSKARFTISGFYGRRVRRIFPALIVVMLASLALGWLFLYTSEFGILGKHITAGATFTSNIVLWRESDYWNTQPGMRPMLHLWSLGVEEQFYIFFPLLMWLVSRTRLSRIPVLLILLLASLASMVLISRKHPAAAFFLPFTRLWELLIGCVLASKEMDLGNSDDSSAESSSNPSGKASPGWPRNLVSLLGLTLVLAAAFFLTGDSRFLGGWALIPTIGTALLIGAGRDAIANRWVLGSRALVGVGLISYPLYLWHWPLLYFTQVLGAGRVSVPVISAVLLGAAALAWGTYRYVECPIRFGAAPFKRRTLSLAGGMTAVLALGGTVTLNLFPPRLGFSELGRRINDAASDWEYPFTDNFGREDGFRIDASFGSGNSKSAVVFIGDSHMQQYWSRINMVLKSHPDNARPIQMITAGGAPTLPGVNRVAPGFACHKFFEFALQAAQQPNVGTVVFTCFWEAYFIGGYPDGLWLSLCDADDPSRTPIRIDSSEARRVFLEFGKAVSGLRERGKEVVVLLSSPSSRRWNPKQASRLPFGMGLDWGLLKTPRLELEQYLLPVKSRVIETIRASGGKVIDPMDSFEEDGFFLAVTQSGDFRFRDNDHLRPFYVRERAAFLDRLVLGNQN